MMSSMVRRIFQPILVPVREPLTSLLASAMVIIIASQLTLVTGSRLVRDSVVVYKSMK